MLCLYYLYTATNTRLIARVTPVELKISMLGSGPTQYRISAPGLGPTPAKYKIFLPGSCPTISVVNLIVHYAFDEDGHSGLYQQQFDLHQKDVLDTCSCISSDYLSNIVSMNMCIQIFILYLKI
jgi:hypothetical protein